MKRSILAVALLVAAAVSPSAQAQCPVPGAPLQALVGTWAFSTQGFQTPVDAGFLAAGGRFTASISPTTGRGVLTVTATTSLNGSIVRQETDAGIFQVDDDCTGGVLRFNLSSRPIEFEIYFVNSDEIALVSDTNRDAVVGTARRVIPAPCPVVALQALAGTWVFSTNGFGPTNVGQTAILASAGRFVATVATDRGGNLAGVLAISATSSASGSSTRREQDAGRFQVNADCSGGTLIFNLSSRPVQFDFYFSGPNSIVMVDIRNGDIVVGSARRFGTI